MKKILFIVSDDKYLLSHRYELLQDFIDAEYEVTVATKVTSSFNEEKIKATGARLIDLDRRSKGISLVSDLYLLKKLRCIIKNTKPDYIMAISIRMVFLASMARLCIKKTVLIGTITGMGYLESSSHLRARLLRPFVTFAFKYLLNRPNTIVIVQNQDDYQLILKIIPEKNIRLIKGAGVNLKAFNVAQEPEITGAVHVSVVARMLVDKGILDAIDAIKQLEKNGVRVVLNLVGDVHHENPTSLTRKQLLAVCKENQHIRWVGHQSDIEKIWHTSHIALLPSYREGLPKSLLEAAACGRPIITTNVPGCREVVINQENGLLVPVRSPVAIAEAITELVNNKQLRQEMGKISRRIAEENFSHEIINKQTLNVCREFEEQVAFSG